ncbi:charged multivesicular body protein 4 [Babesia microti strain RI]|uniref:Charged multivesicular body protein 4 n=1 Tax=Babesia microti (strain RI) TaxID=1133968 RepID=I7JDS1_BABMR|nr:charged multivesicular body protein 4 [Babesia microti strain RI]CCF75980.2 charged multivesicular body protein 4 [Babesia microti strain RI]|eukprot:XP_012650388.2 charged multivesicular body protein 4 [Babesia microti strain RI]
MFSFFKGRHNPNSPKHRANGATSQITIDETILEGKKAIQSLVDRQTLLEAQIKHATEEAKARAGVEDKAGAIASLRKKKLYMEELARINNSIVTLETQHITLESASIQHTAYTALSKGVELQKQLQANMPIEKLDRLIEDMQEQREFQAEINDAFNQIYDNTEFDQDYDELLNECKLDPPKLNDTSVGATLTYEKLT